MRKIVRKIEEKSPNFHRRIASIQFQTNENLGQLRLRLD